MRKYKKYTAYCSKSQKCKIWIVTHTWYNYSMINDNQIPNNHITITTIIIAVDQIQEILYLIWIFRFFGVYLEGSIRIDMRWLKLFDYIKSHDLCDSKYQ